MNRNLDVFAHTIHEIFRTDKNLPVEHINIADMVRRNRVALERILVGQQQFAGLVVLVQCFAAAHIVKFAIGGNPLPAFHFKGTNQCVVVVGQHFRRFGGAFGPRDVRADAECYDQEQNCEPFHLNSSPFPLHFYLCPSAASWRH